MTRPLSRFRWVIATLLLTGANGIGQTAPDSQLHYKIYYQCSGERVSVSYCRKDSDMPGIAPTPPQSDYCLVYYPDRPRRSDIMVQAAELRGDIIRKLQACGALAGPPASTNASSRSAKDYFTEGDTYFKAKEYEKALPLFREAVRLKPDDVSSWSMLGATYFTLKQYQDALTSFQELVRLDPNDAQALFLLGAAYMSVGNKDAAVEVYHRLQTMDKGQAQQLHDVIYGKQEEPTATTAPPANQPADPPPNANEPHIRQLMLLGTLEDNQGSPDKAVENYQHALALNPDKDTKATIYAYQGSAYDDMKQYDKAVASFRESLRLHPDNHTSYMLGLVYVEMGRKADAMQVYQALQASDKAEADHLYLKIQTLK